VEEGYPRLPTPFSRTVALRLLATLGSRDAAAVLARLLAAPPDPRPDLDTIWWETEPRHADLVLPALLTRLADERSRAHVFDLALRLAATEPIAPEHAAVVAPVALAELRALRPRVGEQFDWVRETFTGKRGVGSSMALSELHRLDLIPAEHRTQEALAESELVEWLTYPAELGRPPTEIELAERVSADSQDGAIDLYVFRFRTEGGRLRRGKWFAGVAGPYRREDTPTTRSGRMTFSAFEPWDEHSPVDHAELVAEILETGERPTRSAGRERR
jgi:hypothetical protein